MSDLPLLPISSASTIASCASLPLCISDVFICSYPKSGTTWTQNIVHKLLSNGVKNLEHISESAPFFEVDAHWTGASTLSPAVVAGHARANGGRRVFNTHLLWSMLPHARHAARYIYVVRSGSDVAFSFFKHLSSQRGDGGWDIDTQGGWDVFFTAWLAGEIPYGKWAAHVEHWMSAVDAEQSRVAAAVLSDASAAARSRILVVRFEDLKSDLKREVKRIAAFLGVLNTSSSADGAAQSDVVVDSVDGAASRLLLSPARVDVLCDSAFTFAAMKADASQFQPRSVSWRTDAATGATFEFLRRGEVGDGAKEMSEEQRLAFVADLTATLRREDGCYPRWVSIDETGVPTGEVSVPSIES